MEVIAEILSNYGVTWEKFVEQLLVTLLFAGIFLAPPLLATRKILTLEHGSSRPLWLLIVWLIPIVGSVCAFFQIQSQNKKKS